MAKRFRERLTYANVAASLALFVALATGGAYAAERLAPDSVGSRELKTDSVRAGEVAANAISSEEVIDNSLGRADFGPGQLPAGAPGELGPQGEQGVPGVPGAAGDMLPAGAVSFFNLASCPTGWSELTEARGRYLVGLPSGGTLLQSVGTALSNGEDRPVGQHNHAINDPGHSHAYNFNGSLSDGFGNTIELGAGFDTRAYNSNTSSASTGISIQNAGAVAGTNAPYLQLLTCQKD